MRTWTQGWLIPGLLLGLSTTLAAQHPQVRKGFWIGFGPTAGSADVSCDGCGPSDREKSYGFFLKLGGTLSKKVLIGGEFNSWLNDESGLNGVIGSLAAVAYFYPTATAGLFVKAGAGSSQVWISRNGQNLSAYGWGFTVGLGEDIRFWKNISLTPVGNFWYGQPGNAKSGGTTVLTGWKQNVFEFGVGITFH